MPRQRRQETDIANEITVLRPRDPQRTLVNRLRQMLTDAAPSAEVSRLVSLPFGVGYEFYAKAPDGSVQRVVNLFDVASFLAAHPDVSEPVEAELDNKVAEGYTGDGEQ